MQDKKSPLFSRREVVGMASGGVGVLALGQSVAKMPGEATSTAEPNISLEKLRLPDSLPPLANIDGKLVVTLSDRIMVIEPWGRDGLRVRVGAGREIIERAWALTEPVQSSASIEIAGIEGVIRNGRITARVGTQFSGPYKTEEGYLRFFKQTATGEECVLSAYPYWLAEAHGTHTLWPTDEGLYRAEAHFAAHEGERLYGLGQNANGRLDQKDQVIDLYQRHVKAVIPFMVSSRGYGFLWNNPGLGRVEMSADRTRWVADGCRQIDYYVCTGESYADILERYADVTGRAPMLPHWASGFWQCKLRYETQEQVLQAAREYKKRNLPLSVIVIDYLHWKRMGDWKLDPEFWPDPKAMIEELASMGVRAMISPWVLVEQGSENYEEMKRRHMFITSDRGALSTPLLKGRQAEHYDPTNPEAAQFLWSKWKQNYFDLGIHTFWLDPCDPFYAIKDRADLRYHIGKGVEVDCYFPVAHQKNIHDGLKAAGESEVVTICRSAWAGSQRYGAALWSGDIESSFDHLTRYMKAGLNVAMSGLPWWTTDIGGFVTQDANTPVFRELIVRWYQYGVFCPLFRTHGYRKENEAWSFGEEAYPHIRAAMLLRERLRPYVMEQMKLAHDKGLPPMRPLFFDFSDDPKTASIEDQFLFGPDLLIAPILSYQARSREVYLPKGAQWRDAWTGKKVAAGRSFVADAPLEHIPVYVREGNDGLTKLFRDLGTK